MMKMLLTLDNRMYKKDEEDIALINVPSKNNPRRVGVFFLPKFFHTSKNGLPYSP